MEEHQPRSDEQWEATDVKVGLFIYSNPEIHLNFGCPKAAFYFSCECRHYACFLRVFQVQMFLFGRASFACFYLVWLTDLIADSPHSRTLDSTFMCRFYSSLLYAVSKEIFQSSGRVGWAISSSNGGGSTFFFPLVEVEMLIAVPLSLTLSSLCLQWLRPRASGVTDAQTEQSVKASHSEMPAIGL